MNNQREILFRGFHPCEDGDTTIYVEGEAVKGRWVKGIPINKKRQMIINCLEIVELKGEDCMSLKGIIRKVHPSTVCQCTGLTDKSGRKIYEGDIIKLENSNVQVDWQIDAWCVSGGYLTGDSLCGYNEQGEIIGTIWDKERQDERD